MNQEAVEAVFARVPLLADLNPAEFTITPLAGYTNRNYHLHNQQHDWVLRIPRDPTNDFIDRAAEAHNQALANRLQIAPRVLWRDREGYSLTPTLSACRELCSDDFNSDVMLQIIADPVRRLHRSGLRFHGRVDLQRLLNSFYAMLGPQDQQRLGQRMQQAEDLLSLLHTRDDPYVASHNDLVMENLMFDSTRLWLIDWEYSAMASPYWDLATLCNAADLDTQQSRRLLQVYCAGEWVMEESLLFDYRRLLKLLNDCWMAAFAD